GLWGWSRAIDFTFKSDNLSPDSRQQNMKFANPDRASLPLVFDHSLIQFSPSRPRIFQSRTVLDAIMSLLHPRFLIMIHTIFSFGPFVLLFCFNLPAFFKYL